MPNIYGVHIFNTGTWNGYTFTDNDLEAVVKNYNLTKNELKPPVKLGHNKEQDLLVKDGFPSAGWVENVRKSGNKLIADFIDVPDKIYKIIKNKGYRRVSSEFVTKFKDSSNNVYNNILCAVSLLGEDIPAVSNLDDIISLYHLEDAEIKSFTMEVEFMDLEEMKTSIISELKADRASFDEDKRLFALEKEKFEAEKESYIKEFSVKSANELDSLKTELNELKESKINAEIKEFSSHLVREGKILPAEETTVFELLKTNKDNIDSLKNYFSQKQAHTIFSQEGSTVNPDSVDEEEQARAKTVKVKKFARENKISFDKAWKQIEMEGNK